ncbi:MAG: histidine phosphatase family protein [Bacteroidota bacterium]
MKTLYFIRHAKSSWDDLSLSDHDRPLNARGQRDTPFMAALLHSVQPDVDGMYTSTAKRALTTALSFAEVYGLPAAELVQTRHLYHAYPETITAVVRSFPADWDTALLFCHNPGITDMANQLDHTEYLANVPTCGIVGSQADIVKWADWAPEKATRHRYYYPKQYS